MNNLGDTVDDAEGLNLSLSDEGRDLRDRLVAFMNDHVFPAEAEYHDYRASRGP